jgi:hypothetical protein
MGAPALYSAAGSLLLTALTAAPADGAPAGPGAAELRGTAVAAARARATGIDFGTCPAEEELPGTVRCGTVSVPLDYARPDGRQIELTVSRVRATRKDPHDSERRVPRQGALVFNPGGPGASGMYFPLIGVVPEWKRLEATSRCGARTAHRTPSRSRCGPATGPRRGRPPRSPADQARPATSSATDLRRPV